MLMWSGLIKIHSGSHFDQEISNQFEVKTKIENVEKDKKGGLEIIHSISNLNSVLDYFLMVTDHCASNVEDSSSWSIHRD